MTLRYTCLLAIACTLVFSSCSLQKSPSVLGSDIAGKALHLSIVADDAALNSLLTSMFPDAWADMSPFAGKLLSWESGVVSCIYSLYERNSMSNRPDVGPVPLAYTCIEFRIGAANQLVPIAASWRWVEAGRTAAQPVDPAIRESERTRSTLEIVVAGAVWQGRTVDGSHRASNGKHFFRLKPCGDVVTFSGAAEALLAADVLRQDRWQNARSAEALAEFLYSHTSSWISVGGKLLLVMQGQDDSNTAFDKAWLKLLRSRMNPEYGLLSLYSRLATSIEGDNPEAYPRMRGNRSIVLIFDLDTTRVSHLSGFRCYLTRPNDEGQSFSHSPAELFPTGDNECLLVTVDACVRSFDIAAPGPGEALLVYPQPRSEATSHHWYPANLPPLDEPAFGAEALTERPLGLQRRFLQNCSSVLAGDSGLFVTGTMNTLQRVSGPLDRKAEAKTTRFQCDEVPIAAGRILALLPARIREQDLIAVLTEAGAWFGRTQSEDFGDQELELLKLVPDESQTLATLEWSSQYDRLELVDGPLDRLEFEGEVFHCMQTLYRINVR